jgi:integrase
METIEKKESGEEKPLVKRGKRGQGSVYQPKNSRNWWIKFSVDGPTVQQSASTESKREAVEYLKTAILRYSSGQESVDSHRVTVAELYDALLADYRINEKDFLWASRIWTKHLEPFFGHMRAKAVGTDTLGRYIEARRAAGAANGTINRELSLLQRSFTLGYEARPKKVAYPLRFHRLTENKPRSGFLEDAQYHALAANCTEPYMRTMLALAYSFGFRKAELLSLKVSDVDLLAGTIRLRTSKNGEPRQVNLTQETRQLLGACVAGKNSDDSVFTRNGVPVADFRGTWDKVTKAAGCPGLLFHDLRRSAVRNMVRAGIPEVVCMKVSGHKTRAVFDRYNIVSERDLAEAAKKIESASVSYSLVKVTAIDETAKREQNETVQ